MQNASGDDLLRKIITHTRKDWVQPHHQVEVQLPPGHDRPEVESLGVTAAVARTVLARRAEGIPNEAQVEPRVNGRPRQEWLRPVI